jgi:hypothetical protein
MYKLYLKLILISVFTLYLPLNLYAFEYEELIGEPIPNFSQVDAFGNHFDISDYIGKKIVISFGDKKSNLSFSLWNDWKNLYNF